MSRPFLPLSFVAVVVPLALLLLPRLICSTTTTTSISPPSATAAAAEAIFLQRRLHPPAGAGCGWSAEAAAVVEGCTDDIVRSFFGVRGSDLCCHALETVGAGCYRAVLAGSPFADLYPTILGNVCGGGGASAPSPAADFLSSAANAENY